MRMRYALVSLLIPSLLIRLECGVRSAGLAATCHGLLVLSPGVAELPS